MIPEGDTSKPKENRRKESDTNTQRDSLKQCESASLLFSKHSQDIMTIHYDRQSL
jgi:hypothetical protein